MEYLPTFEGEEEVELALDETQCIPISSLQAQYGKQASGLHFLTEEEKKRSKHTHNSFLCITIFIYNITGY